MTPRRHRIGLSLCAIAALAALLAPPFLAPGFILITYNPSDSAPRGWYRLAASDALQVGDYVLAALPRDAAALAAQRRYLPQRVPLLKRIGAVSPQQVCVIDNVVYVDGARMAIVLRVDAQRRPLPAWRQCRRLIAGELFLLSMTNPASFDSRYFGPVTASSVIGKALPLWTWSAP